MRRLGDTGPRLASIMFAARRRGLISNDSCPTSGSFVSYFGKDKTLNEITDDEVARLVAWRRGHSRWGRRDMQLIAPATVNRSTTEVLQKLFCYARRSWKVQVANEPDWSRHMLREPQERVRELKSDEAERLEEAARSDYEPFLNFARASGQRFKECLMLKWSDVDWDERLITTKGEGRPHHYHSHYVEHCHNPLAPARSPCGACVHLRRSTQPRQPLMSWIRRWPRR
jgi:integrase